MKTTIAATVLALLASLSAVAAIGDPLASPQNSYDRLHGTIPPSNWKWTSCYGNLPSNTTYSFVGSYEDFGVVASSHNEVVVVDLYNGTTINSENLSLPNMSNPISYQVLPNGMLLQLGWATMAAWSLPDLELMWSVDTFQLGGPAVLSTTQNFFCIYLLQASSSGYGNSAYPSCFRVSDGSLLWTSWGNISMAQVTMYESQGILIAYSRQYPNTPMITAIQVETGTYLWSSPPLAAFFLVYEELAVILTPPYTSPVGISALNIYNGTVVWNQITMQSFGSLVTNSGVAVTSGAAYWIRNGSCIWTASPNYNSYSWILAALSQPPVGSGGKPTFLYSAPTNYFIGFNYTIGDVMTGELAPPTVIITPSGNQLFSSDLGYYFFAVHPLGSVGNRYCLHAFPSNL